MNLDKVPEFLCHCEGKYILPLKVVLECEIYRKLDSTGGKHATYLLRVLCNSRALVKK